LSVSRTLEAGLAACLADLAVFLEFSGAGTIDPDAAAAQLEQMAATLGAIDAAGRQRLVALLEADAERFEGEARSFVAELGPALGFSDG
jgi:hypothetical protein